MIHCILDHMCVYHELALSSGYRLKAIRCWDSKMIEKRILWAAIEDYVGLWEIPWEFGKDKEQPTRTVLTDVLSRLLDQGYMEMFRCQEPYGELVKIQVDPEAILAVGTNWEQPGEGAISIRLSTTEKGQEYFNTLS